MFTPERLVLARKRRRMTLAALARESGVSAQSITAFENHRKPPSAETLSSLASALRYPVSFFGAPIPPEMLPDAVSFRAPSKMSALERDSALSSGAVAASLNLWLQERFKLPQPNVPTYPHLDPQRAAEQVRAHWGLGEEPVPNLVHLLEANGVRVFSLAPDCLDADAFSTIKDGTPFVFLNTRKTGERGRFDAAHELGHLAMHCEHRIPHGRDSESEANDFASAFLMPAAGIKAQQLHNASVERILSAKRRWGVSAMALTYRLHKLELLSDWRYNQTMKQLASMGYRNAEPGSSMVRESSQLLAKVFDALRKPPLSMSPADVATQMDIFPEELNDYVFGLVPVGVTGGGRQTPPVRPGLRLVHG
ncbi:ImmA/IrrE family metallo-endopeptidase [Kitasatospora sp. NA04385]|uniref:helix-turn-helix domain-containing protein n=1 Tax=Kitasatospora sp. NA04385 TaxID=2742135 RepID=UPI001591C866|nr:XRE family transcriptional regulator [Kitasatospora sp. NA04385]QKW22335.1 ImmA/IrrE family metallo-endopeptidase [Kitasatospora sp. NA04385]